MALFISLKSKPSFGNLTLLMILEKLSNPEEDYQNIPKLTRSQLLNHLQRLNTSDLIAVLSLWIATRIKDRYSSDKGSVNSEKDIKYRLDKLKKDSEKLSKRTFIVKWLDGYLDGDVTPKQEAQLDMAYFLRHPNKIKWQVYFMKRIDKLVKPEQDHGLKIAQFISIGLDPYFPKLVFAAKEENNIWLRVAIYQSNSSNYPKVFIVYRPGTSYFLASNIKADVKPYLFQAIKEAFHLSSIETINLTGNDPYSLLDLVLFQKSQGSLRQYRLNKIECHPLFSKQDLLSTLPTNYIPPKPLPNAIKDESRLKNSRLKRKALKQFGDDRLPKLEEVYIKVDLPYYHNSIKDENKASISKGVPFAISIKFEGNNVLEGLRDISKVYQLAPYLETLSESATNHFHVREEHEFRRDKVELA